MTQGDQEDTLVQKEGIQEYLKEGERTECVILQRKGNMVSAKQKWWDLYKHLKGKNIIFYGPVMT